MDTAQFNILLERLTGLEAGINKLIGSMKHIDLIKPLGSSISGYIHSGRAMTVRNYVTQDEDTYLTVALFEPILLDTRGDVLDQSNAAMAPYRTALRGIIGLDESRRLEDLARQPRAPGQQGPITCEEAQVESSHVYLDAHLKELVMKKRIPGLLAVGTYNIVFCTPANDANRIENMINMLDAVFQEVGADARVTDVTFYDYPTHPRVRGIVAHLVRDDLIGAQEVYRKLPVIIQDGLLASDESKNYLHGELLAAVARDL
jgi:hypothetical protein